MGEEPTPGDHRPRWSFTWLLRIQRTGRPHREPMENESAKIEKSHRVLLLILLAVVGAETIILVLLDVLPLP